jgi:hypothetical protein
MLGSVEVLYHSPEIRARIIRAEWLNVNFPRRVREVRSDLARVLGVRHEHSSGMIPPTVHSGILLCADGTRCTVTFGTRFIDRLGQNSPDGRPSAHQNGAFADFSARDDHTHDPAHHATCNGKSANYRITARLTVTQNVATTAKKLKKEIDAKSTYSSLRSIQCLDANHRNFHAGGDSEGRGPFCEISPATPEP